MEMSWFKMPAEDPDSPFSRQLREFYKSIKISKDEASLVAPDANEEKDYDIDIAVEGLIPIICMDEEIAPRGRPAKRNTENKKQLVKRIPITTTQRQYVLTQCRNICEYCDVYNTNLQIHHRDGDPKNNTNENLMGVCYDCHKKLDRVIKIEKHRRAKL